MKETEETEKVENALIVDASETVLGRLASFAAKQALLSKNVTILNCNDVIITGSPKAIIADYKKTIVRGKGSLKGPYFPRPVEKIVRRTIRGMLPYKKVNGRKAFKRIYCYAGMPAEYTGKEKITIKQKIPDKFITLAKLCRLL